MSSSSVGGTLKKIKLGEGLSSMHHTTKRLLNLEKHNLEDIKSFEAKVDRLRKDPDDNSYRNQVVSSYASLYNKYQKLTQEEQLINRMERKANIRNIFFRGLTTLIIGFSIMTVYWVASYLGISMPLMKLPT